MLLATMHVQMRGPGVGSPVTYLGITVTLPVPDIAIKILRGCPGQKGLGQPGLHGPSRHGRHVHRLEVEYTTNHRIPGTPRTPPPPMNRSLYISMLSAKLRRVERFFCGGKIHQVEQEIRKT